MLCTGNLCSSEVEDYLRSISPDVQVVAGDMDTALFPGKVVISVGNLSFGLCHGHQLLPSGSKQAIEALRWYEKIAHAIFVFSKLTGVECYVFLAAILTDRVLPSSEMGVDVLVTGHTHKLDIWQGRDGGLYINPGSVSGCPIYLKNKVTGENIVAAKFAHTTMN